MVINFLLITVIMVLFAVQIYTVKRCEKINKNKDSYLATVTHDLKTPTRAQINILNLLLQGQFGQLNQEQKEMLELTCGSSKYMSNLIATILTKYKFDNSKLMLNLKMFNIYELINSLCLDNKYLFSEKNQKIIFNCSDKNIYIYGDKIQIERVLINLLSNAAIYGIKNSTVEINLERSKNEVYLTVRNKTNLINANELKNIFTEFGTAKNSKNNPVSTGLGLYISKQIIQIHKGKIFAKCSKDGICTFGFILPIKNSEKMTA